MKLTKSLSLLVIVAGAFSNAAAQQVPAQEVKKLERAWLDAYEQRWQVVASHLSNDSGRQKPD